MVVFVPGDRNVCAVCLMESKQGVWMQLFALELNSLLERSADKAWIKCQEISCASWWLNVDYVCTLKNLMQGPDLKAVPFCSHWICFPFSLANIEVIFLWDSLLEEYLWFFFSLAHSVALGLWDICSFSSNIFTIWMDWHSCSPQDEL